MRGEAHPFSDLALARRLERAEGGTNAAFVEARACLEPEIGACWTEVAGARCMFDGVGSPLTQSFGLGMEGPAGDDELTAMEVFFRELGAEVFHEVSPMADPGLLEVLGGRGYLPVELTTVLCRPIGEDGAERGLAEEAPGDGRSAEGAGEAADGALEAADGAGPSRHAASPRTRRIGADEAELWAETAAGGWSSEAAELEDFIRRLGRVTATAGGVHAFLAELDGRPIAAGALSLVDGVALLAGASTLPAGRRRGAQRALLDARLRFAAAEGCDLAMLCAAPGSSSQRNAQREGFRVAYTRIKWQLRE